MTKLAVRKNTPPYYQPYAIVNEKTGEIWGEYQTEEMAEIALQAFNNIIASQGFSACVMTINGPQIKKINPKGLDPIEALEKRMKKPMDDQLPKKKNQRRVELD